MLLSLVDSLRCPVGHDEWPLVLSAESWRDGRVWTGRLGCPRCGVQYLIDDGVADFTGSAEHEAVSPALPDEADVLRLAALLDLREPGGIVLLTGRHTAVAGRLAQRVEACYVAVDAPPARDPATVVLRIADRVPLALRSLRGAALDLARRNPDFVAHVAALVQPGGRLVAPATAPIPDGVRVLASDDREWVGSVEQPFEHVVALRRK